MVTSQDILKNEHEWREIMTQACHFQLKIHARHNSYNRPHQTQHIMHEGDALNYFGHPKLDDAVLFHLLCSITGIFGAIKKNLVTEYFRSCF